MPNYYLYQPMCLMIEPFVAKHRIHPHAITGVHALVAVVTAIFIAASAIDGDRPRRWTWVVGACACVMLAGMLDDLDGYIARKYDLVSESGSRADGIADVGSWILTWLTMLYVFGWRKVWLPVLLWVLLGILAYCPPSSEAKMKVRGVMIDGNLLPLAVTIFYAFYPPR